MMDRDDCVELGYLAKAHGVRGEIKAVFDVQDIEDYAGWKSFWLGKKNMPLREVKVHKFRILNHREAILSLVGVDDRNLAEELKGETIYTPISTLPQLGEGHYYLFELEGFQVVDEHLGPLGQVKGFLDNPAHELLVMEFQGREVLIPMVDDLLGEVDKQARRLTVKVPEGLMEVYLGENWQNQQ